MIRVNRRQSMFQIMNLNINPVPVFLARNEFIILEFQGLLKNHFLVIQFCRMENIVLYC